MRKTLFIVLILNALLEGLTALRLILLPVQLEDFDAAVQGGYVLYGFAALSIAMSIFWFNKYGDKEISLAMGLAVLSTFHISLTIASIILSVVPGIIGHGLLSMAFLYLFTNRGQCLPVSETKADS